MKKLVILTVLVSIFSISAIAATYCYGYDYSRGSNNNSYSQVVVQDTNKLSDKEMLQS